MINLEIILLGITILTTIFYITKIVSYTIGWYSLKEIEKQKIQAENTFSIIIAFRNETHNLPNLLNNLLQLEYPKSLYEIILIDDDSTDNGKEMLKEFFTANNLNWKLLQSSGGKKNAIKKGIDNSNFEYIFSTDADCIIPKNILKIYNQKLQLKKWKLISGPVEFYGNNSFLGKIFELEFMSLISSGAGAIGIKKPIMLNAANLVFQRKIALEIENTIYESEIASGDDIFLMHYITKKYGTKEISFLKNKDAIIKTAAPKTLKLWISQRLRWASKAKYYKINHTSISALIIMLFNIITLISLFLLASIYWYIFPILYFTKLIVDIPILFSATKFFDKQFSFPLFIVLEFVYPLYIVGIGILSFFIKNTWKGRKI